MENLDIWKNNYHMDRREWDKSYFKKLVGGINVSLEEKNKFLHVIRSAISRNNLGYITEIDKEVFVKTYPDSLNLINTYYKSLENAYKKNNRSSDIDLIKKDKFVMLMIYAPVFMELSMQNLKKYAEEIDLSIDDIYYLIYCYKDRISKKESDKEDIIGDYDISFVKKIMDEYVFSGLSINSVLKKYDIKKSIFDKYMKVIEKGNPVLYKEIKDTIASPLDTRWRIRYSMKSDEWNRKYFADIIGGIKVSDEEKKECIKLIEDAISQNKSGKVLELNKEILLKAYPDSLDLLKDYYDSLIYAHKIESNSQYRIIDPDFRYSSQKWEDILIRDRNVMLLVYAPYLATLSVEDLGKYAKMFALNMRKINDLITKYKRIFSDNIEDKNSLTDDMKYDLNIIRQVVNDILVNNYTKIEMEKKYKLGSATFDTFMEQLKNVDIDSYNQVVAKLKRNSEEYFFKMNELIPTLYDYIVNGINIGEKKIPFTMLDYYCISNKNGDSVVDFLKNNANRPDIKPIRNRIFKFFQTNKNVGPFVSAETFAKKNVVIIFNDNRVEFDLELSSNIIDYLKKNHIPTNYQIVYTAARRIAREEPLLPLKDNDYSVDKELDNRKRR